MCEKQLSGSFTLCHWQMQKLRQRWDTEPQRALAGRSLCHLQSCRSHVFTPKHTSALSQLCWRLKGWCRCERLLWEAVEITMTSWKCVVRNPAENSFLSLWWAGVDMGFIEFLSVFNSSKIVFSSKIQQVPVEWDFATQHLIECKWHLQMALKAHLRELYCRVVGNLIISELTDTGVWFKYKRKPDITGKGLHCG